MVTSCRITKRSTYASSQSILVQKQRLKGLGRLLVRAAPLLQESKNMKLVPEVNSDHS